MFWEKPPTLHDRLKKILKPLLLFAAAAAVVCALLYGVRYVKGLFRVPEMPPVVPEEAEIPTPKAPVNEEAPPEEVEPSYKNILLVGLDARDQTRLGSANSDTMIIASLEEHTKTVRLVSIYRDTLLNIGTNSRQPDTLEDTGVMTGRYDKANAAYANGGIDQLVTMVERNCDIRIDDYVVVNFTSLAKTIDAIGGIDIWMTKQEVIHMNNYCVETSAATGMDYVEAVPREEAQNYHLNGIQAVSYARIRYTAGNDMKRTQRQRVVIERTIEKAKEHKIRLVSSVLLDLWPYTKMSFSFADIVHYAGEVDAYEIEKSTGFPSTHIERHVYSNNKNLDPVVPVTLKTNVTELHRFLFDDEDYTPSRTVQVYSARIEQLTGLTEEDLEEARKNSVIRASGGEADVVR